jgi:hypothetical protein
MVGRRPEESSKKFVRQILLGSIRTLPLPFLPIPSAHAVRRGSGVRLTEME